MAQGLASANARVEASEAGSKAAAASMRGEVAASVRQLEATLAERVGALEASLRAELDTAVAAARESSDAQQQQQALADRFGALEARLGGTDGVDSKLAAVRDEMIRRDELLESQIAEAHAQMQTDAQEIVAPAKTQVAALGQQVVSLNERLAMATETTGKQQAALNAQLRAEMMLRVDTLSTTVEGLAEERGTGAQATRQLESKLNKVYKALSREVTKGKGDREGLWGSLSELSCRISELRAAVE